MEGGVGAYTNELAKALAAEGYDIHVLTSRLARPQDQPRELARLSQPIELEYLSLLPVIRNWRWGALRQIVDWSLRFELDVINFQYQAAAYNMVLPAINLAPRRLRGVAKTAVTFHDLRHPYLFPKAGPLRDAAVRQMARMADGVITTNAIDYERIMQWGCETVAEIPIGSNINIYVPNHIEVEEVRQELGVDDSAVLLGYFGFVNETKGAETLINALAKMPQNHHVVFVGGQLGSSDSVNNAAFLGEINQMMRQLGVEERVHWTGFLSERRVSTFLNAVDMMVMPYRDGASLRRGTLMAALAHRRPLITTWPIGPTPHLKHGVNVWFVPVDDEEAIVTAVTHLIENPEVAAALSQGAANVSENFSWKNIAKQTARFLQSLP